MTKTALGLIETYGYTGAIEAADVCLKAANVSLIGCKKVRGGLITVEIRGDVGAVKAAINSAEAAVPKVGKLISTHVIPRPGKDVETILDKNSNKNRINNNFSKNSSNQRKKTEKLNKCKDDSQDKIKNKTESSSTKKEENDDLEAKLWEKKVVELRSLARENKNIKLSNNEIKYARKEELVKAIKEAKLKGSDE